MPDLLGETDAPESERNGRYLWTVAIIPAKRLI
jgi:hypothetical protein